MSQHQPKAVALISGGLDSMLAAKVVMEQGVEVHGLNFFTGFCVEGHTHAIRKKDQQRPKRNNALWVAETLDIKLHIVDVVEEYKQVLLNPRYGYGANINPCLDCKIFMVNKARQFAKEHGFDFIITGEVIGQRPMSQRKATMPIIAKRSGAEDRLLRPLCAKNLPETLPEREGWVSRDELFGITGRSRKTQMALAKKYGISDYAQPAGGCCFLTDESYAKKLEDLWRAKASRDYELDDIMLLKVGRHFRPAEHFKVIIGREEGENNFLEGYRKHFVHLQPESHMGPFALIDGEPTEDDIITAARIVARYSAGKSAPEVTFSVVDKAGKRQDITVAPLLAQDIPESWSV